MSNSIVPVHLVVKSMRDSGYKNTAYAVAELIDNSIQHGSSKVDLICLEKEIMLGSRNVSRIDQIAVLDNGNGMDKETLWSSLQFGNGTNLEEKAQTGIGKFGMGLPSSSISQALRVDVWTWQGEIKSALHTYLDVNQIISGEMAEVPEPSKKDIPPKFFKILNEFGPSGTLVVWSKLDRCLWKTGKTIIDHAEYIVGRMYRKFIDNGVCKINAIVVKEGQFETPELAKSFLPNDPLYLMKNTSVSSALRELDLNDPMFVKFGGDGFEQKFVIKYNNMDHEVFVRYSVASETTRKGRNAGSLPHGKHAKDNIGVSVLRAHRELYLDANWTSGYDPRERWWGVEIDFPPSLDEVFGVTNNKQYANNFRELGDFDIESTLMERGQTIHQFKEELIQDNDPKVHLIEIAIDIKNRIRNLMETISSQAKRLEKVDSSGRHDSVKTEAEKHATEVTKTRSEEGHAGESEIQAEGKSEEDMQKEIEEELLGDNVAEAGDYAKEIFTSELKYQFINANIESRAFFTVTPKGGKILIKLNTSHPAYNQFVEVLNDDVDSEVNQSELIDRLTKAKDGMKLLLMAWARYEDEQPDGKLKDRVKDTRMDWGKMASEFMKIDD